MKFIELDISDDLKNRLQEEDLVEMTPIQEKAIPVLLENKDIIGKSQTGTGKTIAFALPAITKINAENKNPQVLVLTPTRELALQVSKEFNRLVDRKSKIRVTSVFGGASINEQKRSLKKGSQIVVGTPGRIMDHIRRGTLVLDDIRELILDEADEMLNMGFREDIEWIIDHIDHKVQTALFSATMPRPILKLANTYLENPVKIEINQKELVAPGIDQKYYTIDDKDKYEALTRLIDVYHPRRSLIFCNTKLEVDKLTSKLQEDGYQADKIHGDMQQSSRLNVLNQFSKGKLKILIATDVAARGIDVSDVDIVFNYDVPENEEYYVHRIGRTGRIGKTGLALTLVQRRDQANLSKIKRYTKKNIKKELIPSSGTINEMKVERFKERFENNNQKPEKRYFAIVEDLKEKGFEPEYIAAVLMERMLPLNESKDINKKFSNRERRSAKFSSKPKRSPKDRYRRKSKFIPKKNKKKKH